MLSRFLPSFGRNKEVESNDDESSDHESDNTSNDDDDHLDHIVEANLIPSDLEKKSLLASFDVMRKDALFCDAAFLCQGVLFRAHRVIVSSWSRWMRAFLCDSPPEEVLSMDIFEPNAFGAVLDYMYGQPLHLTVDTADAVLKVVRRLEMQKLEQQCWRYLMTAIDPETNVAYLHELADRYDCPPLKLAAWRILKEKVPGVGSFPSRMQLLKDATGTKEKVLRGTGFTGPGDPAFDNLNNTNGIRSRRLPTSYEEMAMEENAIMPSVFDDFEKPPKKRRGEDGDDEDGEDGEDDDDENEDDDEEEDEQFLAMQQRYQEIQLEDLGHDAKASDVIMAWSKRLKEIYAACAPQEAIDDDELSELKLNDDTPDVKLHKFPKRHRNNNGNNYHRRNKATGGGSDAGLDELDDVIGVTGGAGDRSDAGSSVQQSNNNKKGNHNKSNNANGNSVSIPRPVEIPSPTKSKSGVHSGLPKKKEFIHYRSARAIQWDEVLEIFYSHMNLHAKISGIPTILRTWSGKEDIMIASLLQKYEKVIPNDLMQYLEEIHNLAETHTESSFVKRK